MSNKIVLGTRALENLSGVDLMKIGYDSVVRICFKLGHVNMGHGTAFVYKQVIHQPTKGASRLYLLTNLHNLKGALSMFPNSVQLARSGQPIASLSIKVVIEFRGMEYEVVTAVVAKGKLFNKNEFYDDFAFISVDVPLDEELQLFALPESSDLIQGDDVFALGFPDDTDIGISEGIIGHIYDENPPKPVYRWQIQHSVLINKGNSGGPTVNRRGVVVGISTWGKRLSESGHRLDGMNFSVNVHQIISRSKDLSLLEEVDLQGLFSKMATRALEEARFGN